MDDIVQQALVKWPNVPACYGWLGLDARANWYLRDDQAQALGGFNADVPGCKGSMLTHRKLIDFIGRNYGRDPRGQWFFQNGPQRVYVELAVTPLVWRLQPDGSVADHMGRPGSVLNTWLDETGRLYVQCDTGFGLLHSQDMLQAADRVEAGKWRPQALRLKQMADTFGFVVSPQALQQKEP